MSDDKIDLEEMRLTLVNQMFEEVDPENEERLENFYTPFQIKLRLKVPVDTKEYGVALQMLGLRGFYKGHSVPMDPDAAAFTIKEGSDGEKYIQTLIPQSKLDEVESFIAEDENFNKYMMDQCKSDGLALIQEDNFICFGMVTSGPSEHFSDVMTFAATELKENAKTDRKAHVYINHDWNEKKIEDYITPYKEGVQSSYERLGIAVPNMEQCNDREMFTESKESLRTYYKICNKRNIVVDDPIKIKNFMNKWLEKDHVQPENNIDVIAKNYISIRRASKYLFNEYYNLFELSGVLNYRKTKQLGAIGEAEMLADVVAILKKNIHQILEDKMEREL